MLDRSKFPNMSAKRIAALQQILKENGADGALYATSAAFVYLLDIPDFWFQRYSVTVGPFTQFATPTLTRPESILWVPAEGEPAVFTVPGRAAELKATASCPVITCYADYFANYLEGYLHGGTVAVGLSCRSQLEKIAKQANQYHKEPLKLIYGEPFTDRLRCIKDDKEVALLAHAAAFTDWVMEQLVPMLKPGVTPFQVEDRIQQLAMEAGAADLSFAGNCICVEKGHPTSYNPYIFPKDRPLKKGTGVAFDMGFVLNGYCSDYGRSFYIGEPSKEAQDCYRALQKAVVWAADHIVPGKTLVNEASDLVFEGLKQSGKQLMLRNHEDGVQGHQIGLEVHEDPWLCRSTAREPFRPGMVFCLEPKIFVYDEIYLRVEDMIHITETGAEFLTKFDR
ncbi:MAG: aminopeptidase P family protein, partial [Firmicutes bacterium]|nr:aminopeptidase P family protein [Bacillota bacterium]